MHINWTGFSKMSGQNREVIVIDDDRSFLSAIVRLINTGVYSATGLCSLAELRDKLPLQDRTCVLTDLFLAGESGLDVPEILGKSGFSGPVLFMTATNDVALIEVAASLSPAPSLRKPIKASTLFDALDLAFNAEATRSMSTLSHEARA